MSLTSEKGMFVFLLTATTDVFFARKEAGRKSLAAAGKMSPRLCHSDGHSGAARQGFGVAELATKAGSR